MEKGDVVEFELIRSSLDLDNSEYFTRYLNDIYKDLSCRVSSDKDKGISKLDFNEYYKVPVFIAEKLFNSFNKSNDNYLNFSNFAEGMCKLFLGNLEETALIIFNIYDFDKDGFINEGDVKVLLSYLPLKGDKLDYKNQLKSFSEINQILKETFLDKTKINYDEFLATIQSKKSDIYLQLLCFLYYKKPFHSRNIQMYQRIKNRVKLSINFSASPSKIKGPLLPSPSKMSVFSPTDKFLNDISNENKKSNSKFISSGGKSRTSITNNKLNIPRRSSIFDINNENNISLIKIENFEENSLNKDEICLYGIEDYIYIIGEKSKLKKVFMNLTEKTLSIYSSKTKEDLLNLYNLSDCFINSNDITKTFDKEQYYQFSVIFSNKDNKIFYVNSQKTLNKWVTSLQIAVNQRKIEDFYEIKNNLGEGKFGIVKLAENKITKIKVAVKTVKKSDLRQTEFELIKTEIDLMKVFKHKNLVQLIEIFEDSESFYIILEYLEGGNLLELLNKNDFKITEKQAAQIIKNIACGVQYLNSFGVIHRDLKPENVMFSDSKDLNSLKIIDFGLVKAVGPNERLMDSFGTIFYVAPEIILKQAYNKQIDIWSIGVILYYILGQVFPFDDDSGLEENIIKKIVYQDIRYDIEGFCKRSNDSKKIIDKCLQKDQEKRITVDKLLEEDWIKN